MTQPDLNTYALLQDYLLQSQSEEETGCPLGLDLIEAAENRDIDRAKALIEQGADVNAQNGRGDGPPLKYAAQHNDGAMARLLLNRGATLEWAAGLDGGGYGDISFLKAVDCGQPDSEVARILTNSEALFDVIDKDDIERFRALIVEGACVNARLHPDTPPLTHRVRSGAMVEVLHEAGADWSAAVTVANGGVVEERSAVGSAVRPEGAWRKDGPGIVRALAKIGLDMNRRGEGGETPLSIALGGEAMGDDDLECGEVGDGGADLATVRALIDCGADVNQVGVVGCAPLAAAAALQTKECCRLLLDAGAEVNAQDDSGATALMFAAERQDIHLVRLLMAAGADATLKTADGWSASAIAEEWRGPGKPNVVEQVIAERQRAHLLRAAKGQEAAAVVAHEPQKRDRRARL